MDGIRVATGALSFLIIFGPIILAYAAIFYFANYELPNDLLEQVALAFILFASLSFVFVFYSLTGLTSQLLISLYAKLYSVCGKRQ